jgi:ribose-phosphate pyrophosphokinase
MVDAARRIKPKKIIGVIPWLGYAKQDKVFRPGEPLAAEVVAKIISSLDLDELYLLDIHHPNIKTFFKNSPIELSSADIFVNHVKEKLKEKDTKGNFVVCAPDIGSLSRNKYISEKLNLPLFQIDKQRDLETGKVQIKGINQINSNSLQPTTYNLQHSNVLMFDDMILSGGTVVKDAGFLKTQGAKDIFFFATHLDPTSDTFDNLEKADVEKIVVTDSLTFVIPDKLKNKIAEVSVASFFKF